VRWGQGSRDNAPIPPDSPVCASRCSGHRTSRSTARENRQRQHGWGAQGGLATAKSSLALARGVSPATDIHAVARPGGEHSPQLLSREERSVRHAATAHRTDTVLLGLPLAAHGKGDSPHGSGFATTSCGSKPCSNTMAHSSGTPDKAATATRSPDLATQPKRKGKPKRPRAACSLIVQRRHPPTALLLSGGAH